MTTTDIQRQYDEIIAPHYDRDPFEIISHSFERAIRQLDAAGCLTSHHAPLDLLDVGMGTGVFCRRLRDASPREIRPFGLDISHGMLEIARVRIPDLVAARGDAADLARHFADRQFDLICTHFVTGFVSINELAPTIFTKLRPGGFWSFIGGTSQGFGNLRKIASSPFVRGLQRGRRLDLSDLKTPNDQTEVESLLAKYGFTTPFSETYKPQVHFQSFEEFLEFGWRGAWLTPFIEELKLQTAGRILRSVFNFWIFPVSDAHHIVVALGRRPFEDVDTDVVSAQSRLESSPLNRAVG